MGILSRLNPAAKDYRDAAVVLEARGRVLQEGDEIILSLPGPIYFRVAQITPVLDPAAPPGLLNVHVGCMLSFVAKRGVVSREFIRVRSAEEAGAMGFQLLEATPKDTSAQGDGDSGGEASHE